MFQNWSVPGSRYQRTPRLTETAPQYPASETRVDCPVYRALYNQVAALREPVFTISPGLEHPSCVPVIVSVCTRNILVSFYEQKVHVIVRIEPLANSLLNNNVKWMDSAE